MNAARCSPSLMEEMLAGAGVPPRCPFGSLAPIGAGTGDVESLSSLLTRLSRLQPLTDHGVLHGLLQELPLPQSCAFASGQSLPQQASLMRRNVTTLSGDGVMAERAVFALEWWGVATGLRETTILDLGAHITDERTMRMKPAWCPVCLDEWRATKTQVYRPLLWLMNGCEVCPRHHVPLETACRECNGSATFLSAGDWLEACPKCHRSLSRSPSECSVATDPWKVFSAQSIHSLLPRMGAIAAMPPQFASNLRRFVDAVGTAEKAGTLLGHKAATLREWILGTHRPRLSGVARCAFVGGGSIEDWLVGEPALRVGEKGSLPDQLKRKLPRLAAHDVESWRCVLEEALALETPVTLASLTKLGGVTSSYIRGMLPDLSRAVDTKWAQWIVSRAAGENGAIFGHVARAAEKLVETQDLLLPARLDQWLPESLTHRNESVRRAFSRWCLMNAAFEDQRPLDFSI